MADKMHKVIRKHKTNFACLKILAILGKRLYMDESVKVYTNDMLSHFVTSYLVFIFISATF